MINIHRPSLWDVMRNPARRITYLLIICCLFTLTSCASVPVSNRRQLDLVSSQAVLPMCQQSYNQFLSAHLVISNSSDAQMVKRVGRRIQEAVEKYCLREHISDRLNGYQWQFNLVEDREMNAWCMPGGKVVVYTGILPVSRDESGLAVVMGHEIAHAVARHGEERMSQELLKQVGFSILARAISQKSPATQKAFVCAFGYGTQLGIMLPYSRLHEEEADHLGLIFMAMAGYEPRRAVDFWERMSAATNKHARPPEFLSTHPADTTRINCIKQCLPEAAQYYNDR